MAETKRLTSKGMSLDQMLDSMSMPSELDELSPQRTALERIRRAEKARETLLKASFDPAFARLLKVRLKDAGLIKSDADFERVLSKSLRETSQDVKRNERVLFGERMIIKPRGASRSVRSRKRYK